jgi:hypothetical protein
MRTTIAIDDDLLRVVRSLARARGVSLGDAISDLVRKGLRREAATDTKDGFPMFGVSPDARPITLDDVKRLEDEE